MAPYQQPQQNFAAQQAAEKQRAFATQQQAQAARPRTVQPMQAQQRPVFGGTAMGANPAALMDIYRRRMMQRRQMPGQRVGWVGGVQPSSVYAQPSVQVPKYPVSYAQVPKLPTGSTYQRPVGSTKTVPPDVLASITSRYVQPSAGQYPVAQGPAMPSMYNLYENERRSMQ